MVEGIAPMVMNDSNESRLVQLDDLDDARKDWARLGELSGNVFLTWEWASTWWRHFGSGTLRLVGCRRADGELFAILPLYRTTGRVRALRLVGHGHAIELGLVCDPADVPAAAAALARYLRDGPQDWDVFLAHDVSPSWSWNELLGGRTVGLTPNPFIDLNGRTWEAYLESKTKNFRDDVRKNTRRLEREHAVVYRVSDDPERLPADLDALFTLHRERWGEQASAHFAGAERFHRDFAAQALERGWLRHALLELDGTPVAANYGFRLGDVGWTYNAGRDPAVKGAGFVLTASDIRRSIEEGVREYRLGRGATTYKDRFANDSVDYETIGLSRGLVGRASLTARRYARALPPRARSWLERLAA